MFNYFLPDIEVLFDADDGSESGGEVEELNDAQEKVSFFTFFHSKIEGLFLDFPQHYRNIEKCKISKKNSLLKEQARRKNLILICAFCKSQLR